MAISSLPARTRAGASALSPWASSYPPSSEPPPPSCSKADVFRCPRALPLLRGGALVALPHRLWGQLHLRATCHYQASRQLQAFSLPIASCRRRGSTYRRRSTANTLLPIGCQPLHTSSVTQHPTSSSCARTLMEPVVLEIVLRHHNVLHLPSLGDLLANPDGVANTWPRPREGRTRALRGSSLWRCAEEETRHEPLDLMIVRFTIACVCQGWSHRHRYAFF